MFSGFEFLFSLDFGAMLGVFWYFFIFELPRYTLSTLAVGWRAAVEQRLPDPPSQTPVSILLVGHNEGAALPAAIRGLEEQSLRNFQIVVVDDGSSDNMFEIGQQLRAQGRLHTIVTTEIRGGKAAALNLGLQFCEAEFLVVMDVDTSLDRDAVARIIAPLLANPACGGVSGNITVRNSAQSLLTRFQTLDYLSSISLGRQFSSMLEILTIVSGGFGAFRRSAVQGVGSWDVGPGDDSNLTAKLRRAGWSIDFAHDAWALTDVPDTHIGYYRQRMRWNRSIVRNRMRKFAVVFDPRQDNFSMRDVLASLNVLWFQMALSFAFVIYFVNLSVNYTDILPIVIVAIYLLSLAGDLLELTIAMIFVRRLPVSSLLPYVFGFTIFVSYYDRTIRVLAYVSELVFRHSYQDSFYPGKVRQAQDQF